MSSTRGHVSRVIAIALASRALVFVFQLAFNIMIPDHKSVDAFRVRSAKNPSFLDDVISASFSGLNHWDGQHFIHVAEKGYDREDKLVFLPLFPMSLRGPAYLVNALSVNYMNSQSSIIVSAFIMNTVFFALASIALFKLTILLFKDSELKFAEEVVLWFAFNPASIFFSATYSESLFSLLTFTGLYFLESDRVVVSSLFFSLSVMTRSNGLITCAFLAYYVIRSLMDLTKTPFSKFLTSVKTGVCVIVVILPFIVFQRFYIPKNFCPSASFCEEMGSGSLLTIPYTLLQEKYWNQGFLRYWQLRQSHNFLIGSPVIILCLWSTFRYFSRINRMITQKEVSVKEHKFWLHPRLVPYAFHISFLAVYCLFFMHIQVAVRFLCSSSPWIYWMCAALETNSRRHDVIRCLFTMYFFVGIALFANGLTWT